jgi:hypothetical protein
VRWVLLALFGLVACGGDDAPPDLGAVLPAGSLVPSAYEDPALAARIETADGIETLPVPRITAFAHGRNVHYWSFQAAGGVLQRHHVLCRIDAALEGTPLAEHPPILEALPGEPSYSPFGAIVRHPVTSAWDGELITSVEAIADAERLGLLEPPYGSARVFGHVAVVMANVVLDGGRGTTVAPTPVYAQGREVLAFDFGQVHGWRQSTTREGEPAAPLRNVYVLTREDETTPLHERARGTDLTGDGDRDDTNNVFGVDLGDADYSPLWREVHVVVPADYASIDTASDETMAAYRSSEDMFTIDPDTYEITPVAGRVISFELSTILIDCPLQSVEGRL